MSIYLAAFVVSTLYVFCKSLQQGNVTHRIYWLIPFISVIMAGLEIFVVATIARNAADGLVWLALALGLGGGLGSVTATYLHHKFLESK